MHEHALYFLKVFTFLLYVIQLKFVCGSLACIIICVVLVSARCLERKLVRSPTKVESQVCTSSGEGLREKSPHEICQAFNVVPVLGHSPGSALVLMTDSKQRLLVKGARSTSFPG